MVITELPYTKVQMAAERTAADVRFGSKADIVRCQADVRFTPKSGHWNSLVECPLCAKSGHRPRNALPPTAKPFDKSSTADCS
jgi:hypothetical protein